MPSPKSGVPGTLVPPADPDAALDADDADPGQVESVKAGQRETQSGKYGTQPVKPFNADAAASSSSASSADDPEKSWIQIKLVDEEDRPVPGEAYEIKLPDGSVASGTTDDKGIARVSGFDPGPCEVSFPKMDKTVWEEK